MEPQRARSPLRRSGMGRRLGVLCSGLCLLAASAAAEPDPSGGASAGALLQRVPARSRSRRFLAYAPDNLAKVTLLQWAEGTAERFEATLGMKQPFERRVIALVVSDRAEPAPIATGGRIADGELVQRCDLPILDQIKWDDAQEALCRLFVEGFVLAQAGGGRKDAAGPRWAPARLPAPPPWLVQGLSRNLYSSSRAQDSRIVSERWLAGEAGSAVAILRRGSAPEARPATQTNELDVAACGMFVGWMLSLTNRADCFHCVFAQLAAGRAVTPESLIACVPGCRFLADLDEQWDRWILRQKRIVYEPGVVTRQQVRQLKAELLLYPGVSGIPEAGWTARPLTLRDLMAQRDARWAPAAVRDRLLRLRVLGTGRGADFGEVVDAYCRFLEALAAGRRRGRLVRLLDEADAKLRALDAQIKD